MAIISSALDQIVRTVWMSGVSTIHPMIAFISLLGALRLFGISGLFLGPLIVGIAGQILPQFIRETGKSKRSPIDSEKINAIARDFSSVQTSESAPLPGVARDQDAHGHWFN